MKSFVVISITLIIVFFVIGSVYQARNLSKEFDVLPMMDFESLGIFEYNGTEYIYENGSEEFEIIKNTLFEIIEIMYPTDYIIKRGEFKDGINLILHTKKGVFYKLYFGYAPSVNTISITITNNRNISIDRNYYLENNDAIKFFNLKNVFLLGRKSASHDLMSGTGTKK